MRDHPGSAVEGLDQILLDHPLDNQARMTYGGDGARCRLLCGGFGLDAVPESLRPLLPTLIRIDGRTGRITGWLRAVFELLRAETSHAQPGAQAVFAKLADVFLAQALRSFLIGLEDAGLLDLAPFTDRQVSEAVALIHQNPTAPWTVSGLAADVGLSRSAFTDRFKTNVGEPPMRYIARIRLSRAASYLATTDMTIYQIARQCGYDNDESLSKGIQAHVRHLARRLPQTSHTPPRPHGPTNQRHRSGLTRRLRLRSLGVRRRADLLGRGQSPDQPARRLGGLVDAHAEVVLPVQEAGW